MKLLSGTFSLTFQGQNCDCPIAGVRAGDGQVELAIGTPFGLRRVHCKLDVNLQVTTAHTFAFDYETGQVTRFEMSISGGPDPERARTFAGTAEGPGLNGRWFVTDLSGPTDDALDDESALHAFSRPPPAGS